MQQRGGSLAEPTPSGTGVSSPFSGSTSQPLAKPGHIFQNTFPEFLSLPFIPVSPYPHTNTSAVLFFPAAQESPVLLTRGEVNSTAEDLVPCDVSHSLLPAPLLSWGSPWPHPHGIPSMSRKPGTATHACNMDVCPALCIWTGCMSSFVHPKGMSAHLCFPAAVGGHPLHGSKLPYATAGQDHSGCCLTQLCWHHFWSVCNGHQKCCITSQESKVLCL